MMCPCSRPANAPRDGLRLSEMQKAGPEGCRRCRGSGESTFCAPCWGTGATGAGTCLVCSGVGRFPARITETINVQGALL